MNLLVAVKVYQLSVAKSLISPILPWYHMVILQFFPIEEAFSADFTDIGLVLGDLSFVGKEVLDGCLVPLLPI